MAQLVSELELVDLASAIRDSRPSAGGLRRTGQADPASTDLSATDIDTQRRSVLELELQLMDEGEWLVRVPLGYLILRHEDVTRMLRDPRWHSAVGLATQIENPQSDPSYEKWNDRQQANILTMEGEDHQRLRRIVSPAFTPKSADRMRPFMRHVINELLDPVCAKGRTEFVNDVCEPYPIPIICEMLGAPREDWKLFSRWATDIFRTFNGNLETDAPLIMAASEELNAYMTELVEQRRAEPQEDLLTDLIAAESDGDRLTTQELLMMANAILLAGTDTTRNQLACALALLAQHPDQFELLAANPQELAKTATEEVMRCLGAVRGTARFASVDIEYRDIIFPQGTMIFPSFPSANHDNQQFEGPLDFDITRRSSVPHMTFSTGVHYCLGAFLARAELAEALAVISQRMPKLELADDIVWKPLTVGIWGPEELHLRFEAGH